MGTVVSELIRVKVQFIKEYRSEEYPRVNHGQISLKFLSELCDKLLLQKLALIL